MENKNEKKPVGKMILGFVLIVVAILLTGIGGLIDLIPGGSANGITYGVKSTLDIYLGAFSGNFQSKWSFLVLVIDLIIVVGFIVALVVVLRAKQPKKIITVVGICLALGFLPYLAILSYRMLQAGQATAGALWVIAAVIILLLLGMVLVIAGGRPAANEENEAVNNDALSEEQIRVIVREEIEKYEAEKPAEEKKEELTKEDVEKIAGEVSAAAVAKHVEEMHSAKEEAVVEEEKEDEEEEPAEEAVAVIAVEEGEDDPFAKLKNKRRANFETRLKNSEFDLRHKYYDLRDHIKSYGLKNRISIPGDSFSAHRKRYVFLTINGKHIKAYFAANPDDYKDSAIPVERTTSKKYEDLPLQFKIRSDLSFRRACKLVDDMLVKEGYTREDKPIKNTQNPDEQ